jgi:uncharacterized protein (TIGR02266 family)
MAAPTTDAPIRLQLKCSTTEDFIERFAPNVTRGGIFLPSKELRDVGAAIRFELALEDERVVFAGEGVVTWAKPKGMGVKFTTLDAEAEPILERLLDRRQQVAAAAPRAASATPAPAANGKSGPLATPVAAASGKSGPVVKAVPAPAASGKSGPVVKAVPAPAANGKSGPVAAPAPAANGKSGPVAAPAPAANGLSRPVALNGVSHASAPAPISASPAPAAAPPSKAVPFMALPSVAARSDAAASPALPAAPALKAPATASAEKRPRTGRALVVLAVVAALALAAFVAKDRLGSSPEVRAPAAEATAPPPASPPVVEPVPAPAAAPAPAPAPAPAAPPAEPTPSPVAAREEAPIAPTSPPVTARRASGGRASSVHIDKILVGTSYKKFTCPDPTTRISLRATPAVNVCLEISHKPPKSERLSLVWEKNGAFYGKTSVEIPGARENVHTRAHMKLGESRLGAWKVRVVSERNVTLGETAFDVVK